MTLDARVCAAAFFIYLGIGGIGPILPEVRRDLGLSAAELGAVVSAFGFARLCVDLPAGAVAARLGFRAPFVLGALLSAAAPSGRRRRPGCPPSWAARSWRGWAASSAM